MAEKHDLTPGRRRFPRVPVAMVIAPLCLGLLLVAAGQDIARSGMGGPPSLQAASVDPAWETVQEYLDMQRAWGERARGISMAGLSAEERNRRFQDAFAERPDIRPAIAAANAIVDAGGVHDKTMEAAEFLVMQTFGEPDADQHIYKGAQVLLARAPDDDRWPAIMMRMDARRFYAPDGQSSAPGIDRFFEEMASDAQSPALRATARYYLAAGLMRSANGPMLGEEGRDGRRQRALDAATGLSAGVEDQEFGGAGAPPASSVIASGDPFGRSASRTFAEAEADLIRTIRHATAGGTALDMTGRRLDGAEDSLSAYRGRVVLIDFWATWCRPCIDVLPELRELVAELPADRFTLLAISVDHELETVTAFREREPMPWTNWHAGIDSDVARAWDVRGFPTYVLVDEQGLILSRTSGFGRRFTEMLKEAVEGGDEPRVRERDSAREVPNVAEIRRAAEQGDPEAQTRLGTLYQRGNGVPEDDAEGVVWFRRAAEQGYADAQFLLGSVYGKGEGVPLDDAESLASFRRAAEQGHDAAQWVLGTMYFLGRPGVPRDDVAAYMWLHLAVSQNDRHDRSLLDRLETRMSSARIAEAQRLAREWREAR